jgi:UDP-N-acetylmuramyl pentapeptide phosphotransferase/UDP-N-acetylglucosamine-1-phosphate transferase
MVTLVLLLAAGAALTLLTLALSRSHLPKRPNHTGRNIPTSAGLALLPIILMLLLGSRSGLLDIGGGGRWYLAYSLVACLVGFVDDWRGGVEERGFVGHLGALSRGKVTTGLLKVVVLGGAAIGFGILVFGVGWRALVAAFLLAGCTNLANLFDVRPGRALKFLGVPVVVLLFMAPWEAVLAVAGVGGGASALFYFDLKGRIMLGDAGAAIWGAVLGYLAVTSGPALAWWVAGGAIVGLTAVAEFSSISRAVEEVGALRRLDLWGRGGDE